MAEGDKRRCARCSSPNDMDVAESSFCKPCRIEVARLAKLKLPNRPNGHKQSERRPRDKL